MKNYSLKAFLTITPCHTLRTYFEKEKIQLDYGWPPKEDIDALHDAVQGCPQSKKIEFDFRTVHQWANDRGVEALIEEAGSPTHGKLEIGEELGQLENDHERAMTVFVKYPEVFRWAMELRRVETMTGKRHHFVGSGLACEGDDPAIRDRLANAIAEFYKKRGKGKNCEVLYYKQVNPARHYFFAYPEDSVKGYLAYDEEGKIQRQAIQPAFEVIFEYNEEEGDLAVHVKGKVAQERMLTEFCTKVLGFKALPNSETEVFDLRCLKDPNFQFTEMDEIPVESITLKMVLLELPNGANQKVMLEAAPYKGDHRQVEAMIAHTLMAFKADPRNVFVRKAKIEIKFKPVNFQKMRPITFTVGDPQYSDLSNDEKSEKARRYLRKWGMIRKHKAQGEPGHAA